MSKKRRNHSPKFKAKIALAAIKGDQSLAEIAQRYNLAHNQISTWKKQLLERSSEVFASGKGLAPDRESEIKALQAKMGEITMDNDFFTQNRGILIQSARSLTMNERKNNVQTIHPLSISRQCRLMSLHRSGYYYQAVETTDDEFILMRWIDEIHIKRPFLGIRRMTDELHEAGCRVNHKKVGRLMRKMGTQALYPKPNTSKKHPQNKVYPYLLRNVTVACLNQVWATDIAYIPMEKGFVYLTVSMDGYSRKILSRRLSNTMDGKGAWRDSVFVERLWRSVNLTVA